MSYPALVLLVGALIALLLRRRHPGIFVALDGKYAPAVVGLLWALLPALAWRGAEPPPVFHDEAAYLLQAQIFATGHWAAPSPPLPELFGQPHVLVTPVLAAKYPPGQSMLLALGVLIGAPALIIFLINALRVGLTFALARKISDSGTALLTVALLYFGAQAQFSSSYFSELTSGATLVLAWYSLWRWREERRLGWMVLLAFALGFCAITRPWSALAFAPPIGIVVLRDIWHTRRYRDLAAAMAVGVCALAVLPLWSWGTLGDWRRTPQLEYTRDYMPFDFPHFGVVNAKPRLVPPPDVAAVNAMLMDVERHHTVANIGEDALLRAEFFFKASLPPPAALFVVAVLVGLLSLPVAGWIAVATLVTTFAAYLAHPTWPWWTLYLFDVAPVLVFLAALGIAAAFRAIAGEWKGGRLDPRASAPRAILATLGCCVLLVPTLVKTMAQTREWYLSATAQRRDFDAAVARLPLQPAIVFVRYGRNHSPHFGLTKNSADWQHAPAWIVYDMGEKSQELMALAPERHPYLFDEAAGRIVALQRKGGANKTSNGND